MCIGRSYRPLGLLPEIRPSKPDITTSQWPMNILYVVDMMEQGEYGKENVIFHLFSMNVHGKWIWTRGWQKLCMKLQKMWNTWTTRLLCELEICVRNFTVSVYGMDGIELHSDLNKVDKCWMTSNCIVMVKNRRMLNHLSLFHIYSF